MARVSVIIAAYNNEKTLGKAIDSILCQTYEDIECIIYNDASHDISLDIINIYKKKYREKIVCINNPGENKGPAYARNCCIEHAGGEYIAIQDADDISFPKRIARQVEFLDERKDVAAVGTYAILVNSRGEVWGINNPLCTPAKEDWVKGPQVIHASTMIRKRELYAVGKYNDNLRRAEDYDLWLKMILKGYKIETIPEVLYQISLDIADYNRRKLQYRWDEAKLVYRAIKEMGIPFNYYLYTFKPLINGLIPSKLMYVYHKHKFRKNIPKKISL